MDIEKVTKEIVLLKNEEIDNAIKELENLNGFLIKNTEDMSDRYIEETMKSMRMVNDYIDVLKNEKRNRDISR